MGELTIEFGYIERVSKFKLFDNSHFLINLHPMHEIDLRVRKKSGKFTPAPVTVSYVCTKEAF